MKVLVVMIATCACLLAGCGGGGGDEASAGGERLGPKPKVPQGPTTQKLIVKNLKDGTGPVAKAGDLVAVHYVAGIYETGEEIESAWVNNEPLGLSLSPGGVLPGWEKGVPGMRVGGRRELIFPATRKDAPIGSTPKDTLVYVIDLVGVK